MQEYFIQEDNHLKDYPYETDDSLMKRILHKLQRAAADKELLRQMEVEEMAYREYAIAIGTFEKKLQEKEKEVKEQEKAILEIEKTIQINKKLIQEKDRIIDEQNRYIKELIEKLNVER